jgi:glycosyltransferase involved in cell wall biosynthesis
MVGEVSGGEKARAFAEADALVVPSHSENFGIVVAEGLAHGIPVIASTGTPWSRLQTMGCGLWVDNAPESLVGAINKLSRMPLREMGRAGREWMMKEFSWARIAGDMRGCYETVLQGGGHAGL